MKLKLTIIAETQYKISMKFDNKYFIEINFFNSKISLQHSVLTSSNKELETPFTMSLEDFQFR
ncbi:hypothetical protein MATR_08600 [Marivirga tractuosa]|uniref:Uncharacterized protein n=1 Tax=Marivirga tractuosa (strain ATCC 23168 / DSM 4126 / NBRC 15989 / NCIMB 1408 / VKM B-1430 / H-43) TaxID=643867 RepID=E4TPC3_MARTH|nr:hypothetical protein Ftrac_1521 [Marivirga tractuosa DSM 4126]BDD14035.1 hypothetical protein MATR_08600 [Marivirga tractuosa]